MVKLLVLLALASVNEALTNCPDSVSVDQLKEECLTTTQTTCSEGCSALIKEMVEDGACVKELIAEGEKYGFSANMTCTWRGACNIDYIEGVTCPALEPDSSNYEVKFSIPWSKSASEVCASQSERSSILQAVASSLGVLLNNVQLRCQTVSDSRRLSNSASLDLIIYQEYEFNAQNVITTIEKQDYPATLRDELIVQGFSSPPPSVKPEVQGVVPNANYVPYNVPEYKRGDGVKGFFQFSSLEDDALPIYESEPNDERDEYVEATVFGPLVIIALGVILLIFYFFFLCGHNCRCFSCCCCSKKKAFGGRPLSLLILLGLFFALFIISMTALKGNDEMRKGQHGIADTVRDTGDIVANLEAQINVFGSAVGILTSSVNTAQGVFSSGGCKLDASSSALKSVSDSVQEAYDALDGSVDGYADDIYDYADEIDEHASNALDLENLVTLLLLSLASFLGVLSVLAAIAHKNAARAVCLLKCNFVLMAFIFFVMIIFVAVECLIGVAMADFCAQGPLITMKDLVPDDIEVDHYLDCSGADSFAKELNDGRSYANSLYLQTKSLAETGQCAQATMATIYEVGGVVDMTIEVLDELSKTLSCSQTVNPLVVKFTQDHICHTFLNGLYAQWCVHIVVTVLLAFILVHAEFVKPYFLVDDAGIETEKHVPAYAQPGSSVEMVPAGNDFGYTV